MLLLTGAGSSSGGGGGGGGGAPTFQSAVLGSDGRGLSVSLNVPGTTPILPGSSITGFAVNGGVSTSLGTRITNTTLGILVTDPFLDIDTVTISYSPGNLTDNSGTAMLAFGSQPVTNNSTVAGILQEDGTVILLENGTNLLME